MKTKAAPQPRYLKDYKKPDFKISSISLTFDIRDGATTVKATTAFERLNQEAKNLALDKWFALQAVADRQDAPEIVTRLMQHRDFTYKNPNRLLALTGSFSSGNQKWFHRNDGAGYRLLAETVIKVNGINPPVAARLLTPLRQWRKYDPTRKCLMENELKRILADKDISNDVYEIVSKSLS